MRSGKKKILLSLVVLWMAVIFGFSACPADESSTMSLSVGKWIGETFVPEYKGWNLNRQEAFARQIDYPVRKCAHAGEYAVLGILLASLALSWDASDTAEKKRETLPGKRIMTAALTGVCYAVSDEFHQLFVPGRSCQFTDVLIDSGGLLTGMTLILLAARYCRTKKFMLQ